MRRFLLGLMMVWLLPAHAEPSRNVDLQALVDEVRDEYGLVGLGAVVAFSDGDMIGPVVGGQRAKGADAIKTSDAWHLGSNTKMLTALIYGRMVEDEIVSWGATLPELFPDLADRMHADWQDVTIEHLFWHRSGLAANPDMTWFLTSRSDARSLPDQRKALVEQFLTQPASGERGRFVYSNLGYIVAGAAIEDAMSRQLGEAIAYEDLFERVLLSDASEDDKALWGFGPPPDIRGHNRVPFLGLMPQGTGPGADNPAAFGPAGTVHVALKPHAELLRDVYLKSADTKTVQILYSAPSADADYVLGLGRSVSDDAGLVYGHDGSNTMNLSHVSILPDQGLVLIINTNQADRAGSEGLRELRQRVMEQLLGP